MQRPFLIALVLVVAAAIARIPNLHPDNFTPLAAMGLFGAAHLRRQWWGWLVPFAALFVSDLLINNLIYSQYFDGFAWFTSVWQYVSFGVVMLVGAVFFTSKATAPRVLGASLTASLLFFLVSNFTVWLEGTMYPKTGAGLLASYAAGLPFLANTVLGDLCYSAVLFGAYAWLTRSQARTAQA